MRWKLKEALKEISYDPYAQPGVAGTIKDLSSDARLNLIIQMQTDSAWGFGKFMRDQDPAALDAAPAQELFRLESRSEPRNWPLRWMNAGGQFYDGGRMIALKNDPIWEEISAFGQPYPPFDYGSGMWVRDILRPEAVRLGLIEPDEIVEARDIPGLNKGLQASVKGISPGLQESILDSMGDLADFIDGVLYLKNSKFANSSFFFVNYSQSQPRDSLGRWVDSMGGGLPERYNIARGKKAMRRAVRQKKDVQKAMYRKGLGQVDFEWGTPGIKAENWDHGAGISHMAVKHPRDLQKIPEAIAKGKITRHPRELDKRLIRYNRFLVAVKKRNRQSAWVVTGFKEE